MCHLFGSDMCSFAHESTAVLFISSNPVLYDLLSSLFHGIGNLHAMASCLHILRSSTQFRRFKERNHLNYGTYVSSFCYSYFGAIIEGSNLHCKNAF